MRGTYVVGALCAAVLLASCGRGAEAPGGARDAGAASAEAPAGAAAPASAGGAGAVGGAGAPRDAATSESRARAVRAASAAWPKVEGSWRHGAANSTYAAYFDAGQLRYLVEESAGGAAPAQYWFDAGELWYYTAAQTAQYGGEGPGALPPTVSVVAEFRGQDVVRAVVREHYGEKKLDDAAVSAIRRRAAELAGAAQDEWSAREAK